MTIYKQRHRQNDMSINPSAAMGTPFLLGCLVTLLTCASSLAGWAGRDFALCFMQNYAQNYDSPRYQLLISALQAPTKVSVTVAPLNFNQDLNLKAGETITVTLPAGVEIYGSEKSPNTVIIKASADVSVSSFNYKLYTADSSVVYPLTHWGTEYFVFTPEGSPFGSLKEFSVTNGQEANQVEVFPRGMVSFQGKFYSEGDRLLIDLRPYESVQIQSHYDLSGSRVSSRRPVGVSTGHTCTWRFSKCNHVFEQLLPVTRWGSRFVVPSLKFQKSRFDSVYVQASQPTQVRVGNGRRQDLLKLSRGETVEVRFRHPEALHIQADHGIQVLLLFNGVTLGWFQFYDPFLINILPTDHLCSSYSLQGHQGFQNQALIVAKSSSVAELRLDGQALPRMAWRTVEGSEFSWTELPYQSSPHSLSSAGQPFALYSVGVSQMNGYGAPAQCAQPGGASLTCSAVQCSADQRCEMKGGFPSCVPKNNPPPVHGKPGLCWAQGDPHYRTFDGRHFNFMGTCTYVIAKNCKDNDGLPAFQVLAQNENRGNLRVSYVGLVIIKVYELTITVVRSETGRVRVDDSLWYVPMDLLEGKVTVFQSGRSVVVQTDFGLSVRYDWLHQLLVELPGRYAGNTCGLCGNFNGNPGDDFTTPSGSQAPNQVAFGSSWKVPGLVKGALCRDDCVGGCERCEHSWVKRWEGDRFCGLIGRELDGPFRLCHALIPAAAYVENCRYDVCMGGGLRHFLCRALEAYAEACQRAGVKVFSWREIARCPARCPAHSHYQLCGSACPATCHAPDAPSRCSAPCVETCACDAGFLWSGERCVPAARCGCSHRGRYVPAGHAWWDDRACGRRCRCVAETRRVECRDEGCRHGETCRLEDGIRECHPVSHSTCQATGDPHYVTFDRRRFNFMGTCVYQLAALCSKDPALTPFDVIVQNDHRGSKTVSYTKLVEIRVYGLSIVISRTHRGLIMVDGELVNLPVSLSDGQVSVHKSGWFAVVTTALGLTVRFDWSSSVFVTLPSTYMDHVCGLCGNYNRKPQDDLLPKGGTAPVSAKDFGISWRVAEIPGCVDGCKGACPDCDITQKKEYEKREFCGLLTDPKGPFAACHAKVDPAGYFEDCVYDVCLYRGRRDVLCQALTAYTSACQAAGANVHSWRSQHFCAEKCPAHSHYELCAPGCPATCSSLVAPASCEAQCREGCVCDEGHVLSGHRCVPMEECGCVYKEQQYYHTGQVFYLNGLCDEQCTCTKDGEIVCKKFSCGPNEKCEVKDGRRRCQAVGEGVCQASGDPHYMTYDGLTYDFQGTCTYTLTRGCGLEGTSLVPFSVQVENVEWTQRVLGKAVAVTKMVSLQVYDLTIILRSNMNGVLVNGVFYNVPLSLADGQVNVFQEGFNLLMTTDFGLVVTYDLVYHVSVTVPGNYRGKTCGLCGNFNGKRDDDFQTPGGKLVKNASAFGKSWKVSVPGVVCNDGCEGSDCPQCSAAQKAVFQKADYCGALTAPGGPLAPCHATLDPRPYFNDCVFDACAGKGDGQVVCDSVQAYASNCRRAGVHIKNWRTESFCPKKCPSHSHYEPCSSACSSACAGLSDIVPCPSSCVEGCDCDAGFFFNGQSCVEEAQCGCYDDGRTYEPGEVVYEKQCKQKCVCDPARGLQCEDHSCPKDTACSVRKGVRGCYNTDPCKDAHCRVKEKCRVEKGEAVCVPDFMGTCWAWGDPHYHTFDGYDFNFQGTCRYVISKTCGDLDGLVPFLVTERNENRGNTAVSYVRNVDITVYGFTVAIQRGQVGRVLVDGELVNLPVQLGSGQLSVTEHSHTALLITDFGLRVSYDWNWKLVVQLPSSYYGKVCGLCGNFNGDARDELRNPAGQSVPSVIDWGKSWQTAEQDKSAPCWDTCKGGDDGKKKCPTCDGDARRLYETEASCGALAAKTAGVFRKCHGVVKPQAFMDACVYDVCLNRGDKRMLCQALDSYSQQCRQEGVTVKGWREKYGCPMSCQPHSHYEECASPCQPSCPFPEERPKCAGTCVESCVCDKGYVRSAGVCVPAKTCGCSYQGRYYKPGQRFWADEHCGRLCECDSALGMVRCREAHCGKNERCLLVDGERACRSTGHATCTAAGDPHYRTFDGRRYDFMGTCVYQLVALCSQRDGLVPFKVTVENEHRGGNKAVSYTKTVTLTMYGVSITLSRDYPYRVMVDGGVYQLPVDYEGRLVVFRSGWTAVVETAAGVTVTFDWRSVVTVTLPGAYGGAVCGLCGNYDGQPANDLTMRDGRQAPDAPQFGDSWRVAVVPGCASGCQGKWCQACSQSQREVYRAKEHCGVIAERTGPFRECHARVDPLPYLEDCMYDACHYGGYRGTVCQAVQAYLAACQGLGIPVKPWRTDNFCPMECPANSHYELCASSCPASCSSLGSSLAACRRRCAEACECDEDFLWSGDACVPVADCGCSYGNHYYRKGEVFYPASGCTERCECGDNGAVRCQKARCGAGETCKMVRGIMGCHPEGHGKCVASGDPHYISFDGRRFDFQGTCVYTLAKVCDDDKGRLTPFVVTQGNQKYGNGRVAVTQSVGVEVYGLVIYIQQRMDWRVFVDDELMNLPLSLAGGRVSVAQEGRNIVLRTDFGLTVLYDTVYYVEVLVPSTYQGRMCGLCGNYNRKHNDDFRLPNGRETRDVDAFGRAWAVEAAGQVCGGCGGSCPACDRAKAERYGKEDACGLIGAPGGPFKACHAAVDPAAYLSSCVFDVCEADGGKDTLCAALQAYALACQSAGVTIQPWRTASLCPSSCPAHSHYELCSNTCGTTCAGLHQMAPLPCSQGCFEGCECDAGFLWDGARCVAMGACGCLHHGRYLTVGESLVDRGCTSRCVCQASGRVRCERMACGAGQTCGVREGVRGCHDHRGRCRVSPDARLSSFDGGVEGGAMVGRGATASAVVGGGTELAALCDVTDLELWFRVVVEIRACGGGRGSAHSVASVHVFFKDAVVTVTRGHDTWVNGRRVSLPAQLSGEVTVRLSERAVVVERAGSLRVSYSVSQEVEVSVHQRLQGKTCGACGNYNQQPKDDVRTAKGDVVTDVTVMVASWGAGDFSGCGL